MVKPTGITNRIRILRFERAEMTQAELAGRIGVTRQTVIAIEKGRYSPSLETAFRIARVFAVPLEQVFQYAGDTDSTDSTADAHEEGAAP
ncbi:helix-turn-helix transcriptional regulator [Streptomyces sp. NPDC006450]|uniref:helix-turn-helix transcriptional regulator n=1 Tax=Streptomyces sp. NPDC006450 TaxID=3155458 RepID=UPI0033B26794